MQATFESEDELGAAQQSRTDRLCVAVRRGNKEEIGRLLDEAGEPSWEVLNHKGYSPLHVAIRNGKHKVLDQLLASKIFDVNARSNNPSKKGWTALHFAAFYMDAKAITLLSRHESNPHLRTELRSTPLHLATGRNGHRDSGEGVNVIKLLLTMGVDPSAQNAFGNTCTHNSVSWYDADGLYTMLIHEDQFLKNFVISSISKFKPHQLIQVPYLDPLIRSGIECNQRKAHRVFRERTLPHSLPKAAWSSVEVTPVQPLEQDRSESASLEPASLEPASSEPASSEPASSEPASSEPASLEPASSEPASFALRYGITAGRLITPTFGSCSVSKLLHVCRSVFQQFRHSCESEIEEFFKFKRKSAECTVRVNHHENGILVVVRSTESLSNNVAYAECSDLLDEIVEATCALMPPLSGSSISVVSSRDLLRGDQDPYIYSEEDTARTRSQGLSNFIHPQHGCEYLMTLLFQSLHQQSTCRGSRPETSTMECDPETQASTEEVPIAFEKPEHSEEGVNLWSPELLQKAFEACCNDVIQHMQLENITPTLIEEGYLTLREGKMVLHTEPLEGIITLLDLLRGKTRGAYHALLRIISQEEDHCGHPILYQVIVEKCKEITQKGFNRDRLGSIQTDHDVNTVSVESSESQPHSQRMESGFHSLSLTPSRKSPPEESLTKATSSPHAAEDSGISSGGRARSKVLHGEHKPSSPLVASRVASKGEVNTSAVEFPSTYKQPRVLSPLTSVVSCSRSLNPASPPRDPPVCKPPSESVTAAIPSCLPYPDMQIVHHSFPDDDVISRSYNLKEVMGYGHEHAPGRKVAAAETKGEPDAHSRRPQPPVEKSGASLTCIHHVRTKSSPIVVPASPPTGIHRQTSVLSTASSASSVASLVGNGIDTSLAELCTSMTKDLSAIPPETPSWRQGMLNLLYRLGSKIAGGATQSAEGDSEATQYVIGLGMKM